MRICQVNLHPSKLYRISDPPPYDNLPLNCTLVRFTDNTVRVQPAHYQLLLSSNNPNRIYTTNGNHHHPHNSHTKDHDHHNDVKQTTAAMERLRLEQQQEREDLHHRFADKSFRALDQVVVAPPPPRKRTASGSSTGDAPPSPSSLRMMLAGDLVEEDTNQSHSHMKDDDDRANLDYLARENAALAQLLQRQERAWKREQSSSSERQQLEQLAADLQERHAELAQLRDAVDRERRALNQTEFWLEAGRIRLVRELSVVYPVTTANDNNSRSRRFLIRGLEIPTSLFAVAATGHTAQPPPPPPPDEEVAAALGFLAHATQLLSKYLDVHLRYRLHCHASRSAIQGGGGDERAIVVVHDLSALSGAGRGPGAVGIRGAPARSQRRLPVRRAGN